MTELSHCHSRPLFALLLSSLEMSLLPFEIVNLHLPAFLFDFFSLDRVRVSCQTLRTDPDAMKSFVPLISWKLELSPCGLITNFQGHRPKNITSLGCQPAQ